MYMHPGVGLLENITTMDKWIELLRLKCLGWTWTGSIRMNYFQSVGPGHIRLSGKRFNIKMACDREVHLMMDTIFQVIHK